MLLCWFMKCLRERLAQGANRREFEQLHQAWPWSGFARFGPTTPKSLDPRLLRSIKPTPHRELPLARWWPDQPWC
jgi:hypothetical protein